jgi:hypothetical protein
MTPQVETDALWKMYQLHVLAHSYRGHVRDSVKKDPLDACFGKLYKDKILLVVVADGVALGTYHISAIKPEGVACG